MNHEFWEQGNFVESDWLESMYGQFLQGGSIHSSWKHFFSGYQMGIATRSDDNLPVEEPLSKVKENVDAGDKSVDALLAEKRGQLLVSVYRSFGYLQSRVSPLESYKLSPFLSEKLKPLNMNDAVYSFGLLPEKKVSAKQLMERLEEIYCGPLAVETITCSPEIQEHVWNLMEKTPRSFSSEDLLESYKNVCKASFFEEFLHVKFTGQKRFSLEGGEALIPMLEYMVDIGSSQKNDAPISDYVLGMSHRGRLNVLTNVLSKPSRYIFMEFEDNYSYRGVDHVGDVKYHKGYVHNKLAEGKEVRLTLLPNPSHLESIDPVVEGVVLAKQKQSALDEKQTLAVLIHGDAAFSGQGVVYETLQLSAVPGYSTSGSLHIVVNNGIGFTAMPKESRSTPYCTDIAKMLGIPVFRVNGNDIPSAMLAVTFALDVRKNFGCDVIIDLCCYRKHGHNESDDPSVTAPGLYQSIGKQPTVRELFRKQLATIFGNEIEGKLSSIEESVRSVLQKEYEIFSRDKEVEQFPLSSCSFCDRLSQGESLAEVDTSLAPEVIDQLCSKLLTIPEGFSPHKKILALQDKRSKMLTSRREVDWAVAESLAFASLLSEGYSLRLSGQDSPRGTFSQRQLIWTDINNGNRFCSLECLSSDQGRVELYNSPLSEYAVLGFEYGYAAAAESTLVLWEAQFGDFSNGAQIIFDQYISSGIQKWDFHSNLVLLLPHGYEGQGPEHSSARIERYLSLAAEWNFKVIYPSTPVQYFRALRQHMKNKLPTPMVIFTPKGLLRHPLCVSALTEFSNPTGYQSLLEDEHPNIEATELVLCSGKIYYDYLEALEKSNRKGDFACIRVESLYPLDLTGLFSLLSKYSNVSRYVWLQEEPINMGAYDYMYMSLKNLLKKELCFVGRPRSSSTATGSARLSKQELASLMERLFSSSER
ncbi:2-oxoglutarate dehydrogenase E1 component [Chlamydiifrater phoenicopteri]|uniref:2-oxoglutarate dehydrogenase E1 component n=1 Tax=Chlamydiifrater phoenicopteri TaxID=2681469 RepID=UPI001BCF3CE9|nr:2-oxoglutarate dehydrogenase E1 component [Chlamydiifrater phoenicopteri]